MSCRGQPLEKIPDPVWLDDGAPAKTVHAAELQPTSPTGLTLGTPTFRWQSPISGVRYRVTVRRGTTVIWTGMVDDTEAAPPAAIVFEPGAEYTWQVDAIDPEGSVRLSSSPQTFVIS